MTAALGGSIRHPTENPPNAAESFAVSKTSGAEDIRPAPQPWIGAPLAPLDGLAEFFAGSELGLGSLQRLATAAIEAAQRGAMRRRGPIPAGGPAAVAAGSADLLATVLPEEGMGNVTALLPLAEAYGWGSVDLSNPVWSAALMSPPSVVAAAADLIIGAFNQSVDVWDSGPFAIQLEHAVMAKMCSLMGFPSSAAGVMTTGGSMSNLMVLILARDIVGSRHIGVDIGRLGLAGLARRPRVVTSELAHFSVARAAAAAGLGDSSVLPVPTDAAGRMTADAVRAALAALGPDEVPVALVATAGTTDFGSIDPLPELAELAAAAGMWFHVDAACGGCLVFSDRFAHMLDGIELADSVSVDFHKMGWQPAASSALLVRDRANFGPLYREVPYLNPADEEEAGYPSRLGLSLETTKRADVLKTAAVFRALGRKGMGNLFDRCVDIAAYAGHAVALNEQLELAAPVALTRVAFRYRTSDAGLSDSVNALIRRRLMDAGTVLVGRTSLRDGPGRATFLKLTIVNPTTGESDIDLILKAVADAGHEIERELLGG